MKLEIDYLPISQIKAAANNPKGHNRKQIKALAENFKQNSFLVPLLVDASNTIICGHGRLLAAIEAGLVELPVIRVEHLTDIQIRAFRIADNKLAQMSHWDQDILAAELKFLVECKVDVSAVTSFSVSEIDFTLEQAREKHGPDLAPEDQCPEAGVAVSKLGDRWILGDHSVLAGDLMGDFSLQTLMGHEQARMVITDPPFNLQIAGFVSGNGAARHKEFAMGSGEMNNAEFSAFLAGSLAAMSSPCVDGAILFSFMDWRHIHQLYAAGTDAELKLMNLIAWVKTNAGMGTFYRSQHELIAVFKKGEAPHINNFELGQGGRHRSNVWTYRGANAFGPTRDEDLASHPTVKPAVMIADAIKDVSKRGDIVLDGFGGSGTTCIAAEMTGRRARLIEINPSYVDLTVRRWQQLTGKRATNAVTGATFDECDEIAAGKGLPDDNR